MAANGFMSVLNECRNEKVPTNKLIHTPFECHKFHGGTTPNLVSLNKDKEHANKLLCNYNILLLISHNFSLKHSELCCEAQKLISEFASRCVNKAFDWLL